jgi:hypothetical protein
MMLRSHLKAPSTLVRQRAPTSTTQEVVDRIVEATEAQRDTPSEQQLTVAIRNAPPCAEAEASHRSKQPLPSILKRPRFHFRRRKLNTASGRAVYYYEAISEPKMKGAKKSVRIALPDRQDSVRPSSSVSADSDSSNEANVGTRRKRSMTSHTRSDNRSSKRTKYAEPEVVAPGLSSAARKREAERPREMAEAKSQAYERQRRPSKPEASSSRAAPRKEKQGVLYPVERASSRPMLGVRLPPAHRWTRKLTVRESIWYH